MRRMTWAMLIAGAVALVAADTALGQVYFGRGPRGGTYWGVGTPGIGFSYGQPYWGGSGWSASVGQPYGGGYYGSSFYRPYGGGYYGYGSSFYNPYYGSRWYSTPSYGTWSSTPSYSMGGTYYANPGSTGWSSTPSYSMGGTYYTNPGWSSAGWSSPGYDGSSASHRSSYYEPGQSSGNQVLLHVTVPAPNAQVWIEEQATQQTGTQRLYISPALEQGNYTYTVRASWTENGREVSRERKVPVTPGQHASVNFMESRGDDRQGTARTDEPLRGDTQSPIRPASGDLLPQPGAKPAAGTAVTGKVVRVEDGRVVIAMTDGGQERTFRLATDGRLLVNGQKADLNELKPGMRISVTPQTGSTDMATQLEATRSPDQNRESGERGLQPPPPE